MAQADRHVMTKRGIHDGLDHFRRGIRFANAFEPIVSLDTDDENVLTTGRLGLDRLATENLADHARYFQGWTNAGGTLSCFVRRASFCARGGWTCGSR